MKILLTSKSGNIAGSTFSISYLVKELLKRDHQVWVVCRSNTLLYSLLENSGAKLVAFEFKKSTLFKDARNLKRLAAREEFDFINAQAGRDRIVCLLAKLIWGMKTPILHTRRQRIRSMNTFKNWLFQKYTSKIIAVSGAISEQLIAGGINPKHIAIVPNGTPSEKYKALDLFSARYKLVEKYRISEEHQIIGCVARQKLQIQLINALKYLDRPTTIFFAGIHESDELREAGRNMPQQHRLVYLGPVAPEKVLLLYSIFDISVLPSKIEGLSQTLLESMALGVPVIATDLSGNRSLIRHGENGLLFENGNTKMLADQISSLTGNPALRQKLIEEGKKTALNDYSIINTVNKYEELLRDLKY